ncbi:MAG: hypothetical protein SGI92_28975 [Bryobacteraceae bacterium]|nr:hypothetical protein [Bryobacteraceae bacterium]
MSSWSSRISILLIVAVLGICCWRARTQSFTIDEAFVYNRFVSKDLAEMAKSFDACNHVLHTLLMKVSRYALGGGEMAARVPSLAGALLYCIVAFQITRLLFAGWSQVLCLALLTLNPLLLDFLIAARGYGLALGLFLWALLCAIHYATRGFESKWLFRAGVLAGLSIAANLTLLIPVAGLGLALLLLASRDGVRAGWHVFDAYGGPAIVIAFLFLVLPLLNASREDFYFGANSLTSSVDGLTASFLKVQERWPARHPEVFLAVGRFLVVPGIVLALLAGVGAHLRRYLKSVQPEWRSAPFLLFGIPVIASIVAIFVSHFLAGVRYPEGRTALYLLPLTFLACFAGVRLAESRRAALALNLAAAALVLVSIRQTDNRFFSDWRFDAGTGRLIRALESDFATRARPDQKPPTLYTQTFLRQTALWYRDRRGMTWLTIPDLNENRKESADYYLLNFEDKQLVSQLGLQVVAEDKISGELLARRSQ